MDILTVVPITASVATAASGTSVCNIQKKMRDELPH